MNLSWSPLGETEDVVFGYQIALPTIVDVPTDRVSSLKILSKRIWQFPWQKAVPSAAAIIAFLHGCDVAHRSGSGSRVRN